MLPAKQEGVTQTTNLTVGQKEFGKYPPKLVFTLERLDRFTRLPNALKRYVESVKPPCDSSSEGALEDESTNDEALSLRVNSEKATNDEQVDDNDTNGAANQNPKEPRGEGCSDVSTWRVKYQQWIPSIVRKSKATSSLVGLYRKGDTQRIENLSFIPIHTDPPTSGIEDWILTTKRALDVDITGNEYHNDCHRILCEAADDWESYSWLDKTQWKFSGTVHCVAMLACRSFTTSPKSSPDFEERRLTSKTGVWGSCCYVCSLVLEEAYRYLWRQIPDRVWSGTLPEDCPLERVMCISEELEMRLRRDLLDSLPKLEKDLETRSTFVSRSDLATEQDAGVIGIGGQEQEDQQGKEVEQG